MADINGYKFGVCFCDLDFTDKVENLEIDKVENLEIFESYKDAFEHYYEILSVYFKENSRWIPNDLWIVWIRKDNQIVQFEQLLWNTRCKLIDLGLTEIKE